MHMPIMESVLVALFTLVVVFFVLVVLYLIIRAFSLALSRLEAPKAAPAQTSVSSTPVGRVTEESSTEAASEGLLKLIDVDEPTAAMIMAIVSDESGIPLSELCFKSIRLMQENTTANQEGKS